MQRVEQRAQIGIDLRHQIARQETQPLAGLHRRARQDDAVDLVARQRCSGHRHREERLPSARRTNPEGDRARADSVDVALLVDRLWSHAQSAVLPEHILQHTCRGLVHI